MVDSQCVWTLSFQRHAVRVSIPGENPDLFRADTIFWTLETLAPLFALFAPRLLAAAAGMLYENFLAELEAEVVLLLPPRLGGVRLVLLNWQ